MPGKKPQLSNTPKKCEPAKYVEYLSKKISPVTAPPADNNGTNPFSCTKLLQANALLGI